MATPSVSPPTVELDVRRYELRLAGSVRKLEKLPMELLILLAERQGQLVTRAEIVDRLWGREVFVEADAAVNTAIRKVRRALEDDQDQPRYLETVVGKGYRFVGPIALTGHDTAGSAPPEPPAPVATSHRRRVPVALAVVVVLLVALLAAFAGGRWRKPAAIDSVAVLPFEAVGGGPETGYLSDGLTESLINRLSRLRRLRVIARASAFRYKGQKTDPARVARELSVRAVVLGRVTRDAGGFVVAVELVDTEKDEQLWGATFDRRSSELEAAREELAAEIADKLRVELTPEERDRLARRETSDPEAYRLYLRGRFLSNERTQPALTRAVESFEQAIARDPAYAQAYSGLADALCTMATSYNKRVAPRDVLPRATAAARKAVELDPGSSDAHASLGQILTQLDWDWAGAERELQRAVELNPANGNALHWRSHYFLALGRFEESERDSLRALDSDPVSVMLNIHLGEHYHLARQHDRAIAQHQRTLELDPNHPNLRPLLAAVYEQNGLLDDATDELRRTAPLFAGSSRVRGMLGRVHALAGRRTEARRMLDELLRDRSGRGYVAADDIAAVYVGLGELDQAFVWLERACDERATALVNLKVEPAFDRLRADPRFADLVRCVGLP